MRRDLHAETATIATRLGFVIEHNAQAAPQGGSCIFAHCGTRARRDPPPAAPRWPDDALRGLLAWLRAEPTPAFVLLPEHEYARLQAAWHLPALADTNPVSH